MNVSYSWGSTAERYRIVPGKVTPGFVFSSAGLPAIRDIRVDPNIDTEKLGAEYEENSEKLEILEEKVKWTGKTIGPKAPPKTLNIAGFLSDLIGSKDQSVQLGWVKNKGVLNSLEVKLNEAQKKIASGDLKAAKNILTAFLSEVAAQKDKGLSPEAYAILYFNAKYLIDHM